MTASVGAGIVWKDLYRKMYLFKHVMIDDCSLSIEVGGLLTRDYC